jgi:hypothetical protein
VDPPGQSAGCEGPTSDKDGGPDSRVPGILILIDARAVSQQHAPIKQAVVSNGVGLTFVDCRRLRRIGHGAIPYGFAGYIRPRCRVDAARPTPT